MSLRSAGQGAKGKGQRVVCALMMGAMVAVAAPLAAQSRAGTLSEQIRARQEVVTLEDALEAAVQSAAQMLNQHVQAASVPEEVLLTGLTSARGFRLDGYGAVFDVEFPSIRRSVAWTMRELERPDPDLLAAMKVLRKNSQAVADPVSRQELDRNIKALEDQIKAYDSQMKTVSSTAPPQMPTVEDPRVVYAVDLTNALINAVLDHGAPVGVGSDEWLTVAAREGLDFRFMPDDPSNTSTTLILRIKGSDLAALREGHLSRDEARKRIEVKQY